MRQKDDKYNLYKCMSDYTKEVEGKLREWQVSIPRALPAYKPGQMSDEQILGAFYWIFKELLDNLATGPGNLVFLKAAGKLRNDPNSNFARAKEYLKDIKGSEIPDDRLFTVCRLHQQALQNMVDQKAYKFIGSGALGIILKAIGVTYQSIVADIEDGIQNLTGAMAEYERLKQAQTAKQPTQENQAPVEQSEAGAVTEDSIESLQQQIQAAEKTRETLEAANQDLRNDNEALASSKEKPAKVIAQLEQLLKLLNETQGVPDSLLPAGAKKSLDSEMEMHTVGDEVMTFERATEMLALNVKDSDALKSDLSGGFFENPKKALTYMKQRAQQRIKELQKEIAKIDKIISTNDEHIQHNVASLAEVAESYDDLTARLSEQEKLMAIVPAAPSPVSRTSASQNDEKYMWKMEKPKMSAWDKFVTALNKIWAAISRFLAKVLKHAPKSRKEINELDRQDMSATAPRGSGGG